MEEILRMEHITKRFGDMYANRDINLDIRKGEVHTLLGENGAGKSTLMNVLIGLYQPTEGKIFLNGQEVRIDSPAKAVQLGIGMVHQHFMLVEAMTVFENIILGDRQAKGVFIQKEQRRREILALAEKYGLDVQLDKLITDISVGEQQRVEILKALYRGGGASHPGRTHRRFDGSGGGGPLCHHRQAHRGRKERGVHQPQDA